MNFIRNFTRKYLYSAAGIILIAILFIALNAIVGKVSVRKDLTEDKLYTLSQGTMSILKKLDTPVTFRFYRSQKENMMPVSLRAFGDRVEDTLREYARNSNGNITLETFDPTPDSDAEDSATMDGISGQTMEDGRKFYLGLAVACLDKTVTIPFVSPMEEDKLEYNITRAVYEVSKAEKPVIGIISKLPVVGGGMIPFMQNQKPKPPWIFIQELKRNFEVQDVAVTSESIPENIHTLMVIHPQNLPKKLVFAIDQFLLGGGRLVIAVDPYCLAEQRTSMQAMMGQQTMPGSSDIPELFKAWDLNFTKGEIVVDPENGTRNVKSTDAPSFPAVLDFIDISNPENDTALVGIKHLNLIFAGAFSGDATEGLKKELLLSSSGNSILKPSFLAQAPGKELLKDIGQATDKKSRLLILKLTGKFKTAFPDGAPKDESPEKKGPDEKEEKKESKADSLKESIKDSSVVLLSDVDMLLDEFCVAKQNILGRTFIQPYNDNLMLIQNIVEQLSGDNDLIAIRSKKIKERPLTKLIDMQKAAQDKYEKKILELEEEKQKAQARINQLQQTKIENQKLILSKEQKEELEKFRQKTAETSKELKKLRKEFKKESDRLVMKYELFNIAFVPFLVIIFGIGVYSFNKIRSRRRK